MRLVSRVCRPSVSLPSGAWLRLWIPVGLLAVRQTNLSQGVARASQLLSTRVDMARREQNQAVLESMNRRAALQLRLQEAVEASFDCCSDLLRCGPG